MKKLILLLGFLLFANTGNCAVGWYKGSPAIGDNPGSIYSTIGGNNNALDLVLSNYRQGCALSTLTSSTFNVGAGEVIVSNAGATIRIFTSNASLTSVSSANLDTGSLTASTTYYVYAIASAQTDVVFTVKISTSSTAPSGVTYYKKLGSVITDASINFASLNDNLLPSVLDYGSSSTVGSGKANSEVKICYGYATIPAGGSLAITGLPFTSATSYTVATSYNSASEGNFQISINRDSASQFTARKANGAPFFWIAIGS